MKHKKYRGSEILPVLPRFIIFLSGDRNRRKKSAKFDDLFDLFHCQNECELRRRTFPRTHSRKRRGERNETEREREREREREKLVVSR